MFKKFSSDEVSAQNQVKASVQRRIQQSIAVRDPNIMKKLQVDRGAIKFVLAGANIVCPGLTSPGGALDEEVEAETPVAIIALAIGFTKMSAKDIKKQSTKE
ncbi:malignant T-cell-amplified sequence 1-like [Quillaja saponaria]|uniref:Malignant T-cell-amplified sequence 1-like n=1 Tax=Quillaja saponaria TaxID=32244 RepID=A0AAD7Q1U9_QUISA|nr:malignant T-cell-amplified sequence 1-like [Quillaja saponaria]